MYADQASELVQLSPKALFDRTTDDESGTLDELLLAADNSYDRAAWTELFGLWSVDLSEDAISDYCEYAKQYGLQCLQGQGDWDTLQRLDRPAILRLVAADGRRIPVVLQHLGLNTADLIIGASLYRLDIGQIERFWAGDYSLMLQTPPGGQLNLRAGSQAEDVRWLRQQLELALSIEDTNQLPFVIRPGTEKTFARISAEPRPGSRWCDGKIHDYPSQFRSQARRVSRACRQGDRELRSYVIYS